MTIGTTSIAPRMIPQALVHARTAGQRSILNPASVVVSAFRTAETVPSVFDGATVHSGPGDIFGAGVPDVPSSDRSRRIGMRGYGDATVDASFTTASDSCGSGAPAYVPPDDRASFPTPVANEMFKWDYMVLTRPGGDRCDILGYTQERNRVYENLMAIWRSLSPAQQAQANTEALKVAANPPLTGTPAWLGGPAAPTAPTGFFATLLGGISAASQAAAAVAQAAAAQQTSFLLQQAQAAQQARAQGTSIAAQQSATAVKNVGLLAKLTSGSPSRSTTLPLQTITPGKPVSTGLIVGGVLAAAAIGGILYWQMSKKKAA